MAVFKCVNESYDWNQTVEQLCTYILDPQKTFGYIGGVNVRPETAALEMNAVKNVWRKPDGRQMRHYILSFSDNEAMTDTFALQIANQVAMYYGQQYYQVIYGVHVPRDYSEHYHIHFGMNTVSYEDGKKYSGAWQDYYKFRKYINDILQEYGYRLQKSSNEDDFEYYGYF